MNDRFIGIVAAALDAFGFRGRGFRVGKGFALVLNDLHTVNIMPGPGDNRARVFCFVGATQHVPPGINAAGSESADMVRTLSQRWRTHHEDRDGITWSLGYESVSGLVLLSTDAALDTLDTATVNGWLESFFENVREVNRRLVEGWRAGERAIPPRREPETRSPCGPTLFDLHTGTLS